MDLQNIQRRLRKPTRFFYMGFLIALSAIRCAPFRSTRGTDGHRIFKVYTRAHEWFIYWVLWGLFGTAAAYHVHSFIIYLQANGLNLYSTVNVIFVLAYSIGFFYSLCFALNGREAAVLLNTAIGFQRSEILRGIAWDMDFVIQSFAVQFFPMVAMVILVSSTIIPWLYPDAPWLLCKVEGTRSFSIFARVAIITITETVNISMPVFLCLGAPSLFLVGFTTLKLSMKRLR